MYAVYGNGMVLESTFEPFVFVLFFSLLSIICLDRFQDGNLSRGQMYGYAFLAGLTTGFTIIVKPNYILFLPIAIIWLLYIACRQRSFRQRVNILALFLGMTAIVVLPVTIRNYLRFHDIVLVTADYGKVFFHGNGPNATGFLAASLPDQENWQEPDYAHVTFRQVASEEAGRPLLPSETARFWFRLTLQEIFANPRDHLFLELKKAHLFFHNYEMHLIGSAFVGSKVILAYPFLQYGIISSLAIYGMILGIKRFKSLFLLYGVVCTYFFSCLIFYVTSRYRGPAVPYLCLFAGFALYSIYESVIRKQIKKFLFGSLCVAILLAANYFPYQQEIGHIEPLMKKQFAETLRQWNTDVPDEETDSEQ
jgi:4-amino-4-deoxy-L-arabinose transferase-like glycosyltransferase